jgi:hypothetical protein
MLLCDVRYRTLVCVPVLLPNLGARPTRSLVGQMARVVTIVLGS